LLREGTVLRYKGFVITHKGKKVDVALLNEDNLKDRFQLERIRLEKELKKVQDSMPPLMPDKAFKKFSFKTDVNVPFAQQIPRVPNVKEEKTTPLPTHMHLKAQRNSHSVLSKASIHLNNFSFCDQNHGIDISGGPYSSFDRTVAQSTASQLKGARAQKAIKWQQRMYL